MSLSPTERSLRARIGAFSLHAQRDPRETTAKARERFLQRFIDEVDPQRVLAEAERMRRAEAARKAYFARLALKSARKRSAVTSLESRRLSVVIEQFDGAAA